MLEEKTVDQVAVIDLKLAPPPGDIAELVHGFTADATDEQQVGGGQDRARMALCASRKGQRKGHGERLPTFAVPLDDTFSAGPK